MFPSYLLNHSCPVAGSERDGCHGSLISRTWPMAEKPAPASVSLRPARQSSIHSESYPERLPRRRRRRLYRLRGYAQSTLSIGMLPNAGCRRHAARCGLPATDCVRLQVKPAFTSAMMIGCVYCSSSSVRGDVGGLWGREVTRHRRGVRSRDALTDGCPVTSGDLV